MDLRDAGPHAPPGRFNSLRIGELSGRWFAIGAGDDVAPAERLP